VIPSSSLEKSLLVGDYLFVSKCNYGPRSPMTPLSFPLAQHTLPIFNCKSYVENPQWEYKRLAGFEDVKLYDIVVFNFPAGDTVAMKVQNPDYYTLTSTYGRDKVWNDKETFGEIVWRPVDRRENYVKRCVGLPGDNLLISDRNLYINGQLVEAPEHIQFNYFVETTNAFTEKTFQSLGVSKSDYEYSMVSTDWKRMLQYQPNEDGTYPLAACPALNTAALIPYGLVLDGSSQNIAGAQILSVDWTNPYDDPTGRLRKTENTVSIHWYAKSWLSKGAILRSKLTKPLHRIFGVDFFKRFHK
jgi:signal peptidase I